MTRNEMTRKLLTMGILLVLPVAAAAQDQGGWYIQLGAANVGFSENADISAGGAPVPGSNATIDDNGALALGIGYRFSPTVSVIGIFGIPPTTSINGSGTLAGLKVGEVTYGPAVLAVNYHFPTGSAFQPFLGGGISYTKIFDTEDASVQNLEADDAFGPVLRVGFDYMVDDRNGFFLSANKIFTSTTVNGTAAVLGGAPVSADIDLDPLIIHAGWTHRF